MELRRIQGLPPYVFAEIDQLKLQARRAGSDVIDLGFGNPDIPSPDVAVEKLAESVHNPRNHRYSASRGIPKLRQAIADLYLRRFGVQLDPDREVGPFAGRDRTRASDLGRFVSGQGQPRS
jgi:alanine-synthesizing transaminase